MPVVRDPATGRLIARSLGDPVMDKIGSAGGAGAPVNATYITVSLNGTLTDERRLQVGTGLSLTDGGAGADITLAISDSDLTAIRDLAATAGMLSRTGAGAFAARTLTAPAAGLTISNPTGAAGDPTFALANDLSALEGLGSTGIAVRSAADTWVQRSIAVGSAKLTVSNGSGAGGNPTVDLGSVAASDLSNGVQGSGQIVLATSPTLTTPVLGVATATSINKVALTTPATSATLTIADGKTLTMSNTLTFTGTDTSTVACGAGGTIAYTSNNLSVFAATTSLQLKGVISDETGSGALVFATSPALTTPDLGVPTAGTLTACTGLPVATGISGLGTGVAAWLATPTSANLLTAVATSNTGSGALVFGTAPTFTTSIVAPIVYGGSVTGSTLDLRPSSAANYTGAVNIGKGAGDYGGAASLIELWPDGMTFGFGASIKAVSLNSTMTQGANGVAGLPVIQLFSAAPTIVPKDTTITDYASTVVFNAQPVFQATTATNVVSGLGRALQWKPIIKRTAAGSITFSELTAVFDLPIINPGTTVTNRYGLWFNEFLASGGTVTTQTAVQIEALTSAGTNLAIVSAGTATQTRHAGPVAIGTNTGPNTTNGNVLELVRTHTLAAGISDGQSAGLVLSPTYSGAFTATRHSYIKATQVALAASAAVTDAAVYWFDAAIGTHKALASPGAVAVTLGTGPTGSTAGNPQGWMKINVNGTIRYIPFW